MAKQTILTERGTGEVMYPHTLASLVQTADGGNVDEGLEKAKFALFVDMWNRACGKYGKYDPVNAPDAEHPFYLNELWLTYEEALSIYQISDGWNSACGESPYSRYIPNKNFIGIKARTLIPAIKGSQWMSLYNLFTSSEIEVIRVIQSDDGVVVRGVDLAFANCRKLRKILGTLSYVGSSNAFQNCPLLEEVKLTLSGNLNLKDCPKLRLSCFQFMAAKSDRNYAGTVTVHPDVYAKLTGDTANAAAAALTQEELAQWQQALTDAVAKNINFATT